MGMELEFRVRADRLGHPRMPRRFLLHAEQVINRTDAFPKGVRVGNSLGDIRLRQHHRVGQASSSRELDR